MTVTYIDRLTMLTTVNS